MLDQAQRVCLTDGCGCVLSRWNSARICQACSSRLEQGGPLIRQPRFEPRPPPPTRPVLEGAVPLPGVVPGRERTYAEMIAPSKPAAPVATKPACAECGADLPKGHQGWLCRLCVAAAALPVEPAETAPPAHADAPKTAAKPNRPKSASAGQPAQGVRTDVVPDPAQTGTAKPKRKRAPAGGKRGQPRRFDYALAVEHFRECGNYCEVARRVGVSQTAARRGIEIEIGREAATALIQQPAHSGGRSRGFDYEDAARMFSEHGNMAQVARDLGFSEAQVDRAIRTVLGSDGVQAVRDRLRIERKASAPDTTADLTRLVAELDEIHDQQTRLYARWRVAAARYSELIGAVS